MTFQKNFSRSSNSKKRRLYYGWVVLVALLIIVIILLGILLSFGVFFKPLQEDFGWSRALTSGVYSVNLALCGVLAILGGWALDRYGPRIVFTVMGFFAGLGLLLTSQVSAPWHLFITYGVLLAIGTGPAWVTSMSTASRWFIRRRGLALGILMSATGIGMIIVPPVSSYLISGYGWHTSFLILALISFFIVIPCALLLKRPPTGLADLPENEKSEVINLNSPERQNYNEPGEFSLFQAAKTRNFWLICAISFLSASCSYAVIAHVVPHAIDLDITSMQAASILSLIGGITILGGLLMGRISDSIGRKQACLICALLMVGAMLWLIGSSNLWMFYLFATLFGFSYGGIFPPLTALIGDSFGMRHIGLIMGVIDISWAAGGAVGPTLAGYLFDIAGNYVLAFFLTGVIAMIIAAVATIFLRTPPAKMRGKAIQ